MTMVELLEQAGLLGGNDTVPQAVADWYNNWQQRVSKSWPWPDLKKRISGVLINAGDTSISIGRGTNGVNTGIHRIFPPIIYRDAGYTQRGRALVQQRLGGSEDRDETTTQASTRLGLPETFRFQKSETVKDKWTLYPDPVPSVNLYLTIDYQEIPAALTYTDNANELWYPSPRTSVQAAKVGVIDYENNGVGRELDQALEHLASLVIEDRDSDGSIPGDNEDLGLDERYFVQGDDGSKWSPWRR